MPWRRNIHKKNDLAHGVWAQAVEPRWGATDEPAAHVATFSGAQVTVFKTLGQVREDWR